MQYIGVALTQLRICTDRTGI